MLRWILFFFLIALIEFSEGKIGVLYEYFICPSKLFGVKAIIMEQINIFSLRCLKEIGIALHGVFSSILRQHVSQKNGQESIEMYGGGVVSTKLRS